MPDSLHIRHVSNLEIGVEFCLLFFRFFFSAVILPELFLSQKVKVAFFLIFDKVSISKKILSLVITLNQDDQLNSK